MHDGVYSAFRGRRFGAPADDVPPERFVVFAQNHDQVGNRAFGDRLPAEVRPLAALVTLLSPFTPMLFMGEEYGETAPFQFFTDHIDEEIATATREGRRARVRRVRRSARRSPIRRPRDVPRSKLTRDEDPRSPRCTGSCSAARRELRGPATGIECDEPDELAARRPRRARARRRTSPTERRLVPCAGDDVVVATARRPTSIDRRGHRARPAVRSAGPMSEVWPGRPFPLGAEWDGDGTNFSLFSEHAERVELCLFDVDEGEERIELTERTALNWHCYLPGVGPGTALRLPRPRARTTRRTAIASTRPSC